MVFSYFNSIFGLSHFETFLNGIGRFDLILSQTNPCRSILGIEIDLMLNPTVANHNQEIIHSS